MRKIAISGYNPTDGPTQAQITKIDQLRADGYIWNQRDSISAAGVVMDKGDDRWFFGLSGEIEHIGSFKS